MTLRLHTIKKHAGPLALLLAVMLLLFPVSQHALPGILVCIESNGAIEVEDGRTGDCVPVAVQTRPEVHRTLDAEEVAEEDAADCASCFDVLLLTSPADGQPASLVKTTLQVDDVKLAALVSPFPTLPSVVLRGAPPLSTSSPLPSPPALVRSVVLLI